jgi:hypothetical protein
VIRRSAGGADARSERTSPGSANRSTGLYTKSPRLGAASSPTRFHNENPTYDPTACVCVIDDTIADRPPRIEP